MEKLRIVWANLPGFLKVDVTKNSVVGISENYYKELYYYVFRKFNLTFVVPEREYEIIAQNGGIDYVKIVNDGHADASTQITSGLNEVPKNITLGPVNLYFECEIVTFPEISLAKYLGDSLDHLLQIEMPIWLILLLTATLVACLTTYLTDPYYMLDRSKCIQSYGWKILFCGLKQKVSLPKLAKVQFLWVGFILGLLVLRTTSENMIEVYRQVVTQFRSVDTLEEMINSNLIPIISSVSACYYFLDVTNPQTRLFFKSTRLQIIYQGRSKQDKFEMLQQVIRKHKLSRIAILWSSIQRGFERPIVCARNPEFYARYGPYTSKRPFHSRLNYVLMNAKINPALKHRLNKYIRPVMDMGLVANLQRNEIARRVRKYEQAPQPSCLYASIQSRSSSWTPLSVSYFRFLFGIFMFLAILSTAVFVIELHG